MKLLKNLFRRKRSVEFADVPRAKIDRVEISGAKVHKVQVEKTPTTCSAMTMKFRNTVTGEVRLVNFDDDEAFDECMGNKDMQLIFG